MRTKGNATPIPTATATANLGVDGNSEKNQANRDSPGRRGSDGQDGVVDDRESGVHLDGVRASTSGQTEGMTKA